MAKYTIHFIVFYSLITTLSELKAFSVRKQSFNISVFTNFLQGAYHLNVTAIIGQNAEIPCELTPHTKTDNAYLVLWWYKDIFGTPIYRYVTNLLDYLTPQKKI